MHSGWSQSHRHAKRNNVRNQLSTERTVYSGSTLIRSPTPGHENFALVTG